MAVDAEIIQAPTDRGLLKELREVDDQIARGDTELNDEVKMKLTEDEKAHSIAWRCHQESTESIKKSRSKIYSLLLGQCTQVLVDKMKQDTDWVSISDSFDPHLLFKLIKKFVLRQFDNQYKTAVLIAEQLPILQFHQDDQLGNASYYDRFTKRVEVARQAGVCYYSQDLLEDKTTQLKIGGYDTLSGTNKKKVIDSIEQDMVTGKAGRAEKNVANDYSKGNTDA
jgi:hypothetical protein